VIAAAPTRRRPTRQIVDPKAGDLDHLKRQIGVVAGLENLALEGGAARQRTPDKKRPQQARNENA